LPTMQITAPQTIGLGRQLITCALMCAIAISVILVFHAIPRGSALFSGFAVINQAFLGLAFGALAAIGSLVAYKFSAQRATTRHTIESYSRLNLTGWNPIWLGLAAGFGEELLFRGALQPLLGIWATSGLFVLAHVRAYRFSALNKMVGVQALGLFAASVVLGFIAHYAGLLTAILAHASIDVVALFTVRGVSRACVSA